VDVPILWQISHNSVLQSLGFINIPPAAGMWERAIEIEKCTALQRVCVQQTDDLEDSDGDSGNFIDMKVKACPHLTSLYVDSDAGGETALVKIRIDECPTLTELYIMGEAPSADIYRLSSLTSLAVSELDGRDDWPVQTFLDCLQCLKVLDNLTIMRHSFTEKELTVASSSLRVFKIEDPYPFRRFKLQRLNMQCPNMEELEVCGSDQYCRYDDNICDKDGMPKRGSLRHIDFSACAKLRDIWLDYKFVHSLSPKFVLDLVSNGRNQELIRRRQIIHLINLIHDCGGRLVCKEMLNL